jgi:hypothetical protein
MFLSALTEDEQSASCFSHCNPLVPSALGGWAGPRGILNMAEREVSLCLCHKSKPNHPAHSQDTSLSYPTSVLKSAMNEI